MGMWILGFSSVYGSSLWQERREGRRPADKPGYRQLSTTEGKSSRHVAEISISCGRSVKYAIVSAMSAEGPRSLFVPECVMPPSMYPYILGSVEIECYHFG